MRKFNAVGAEVENIIDTHPRGPGFKYKAQIKTFESGEVRLFGTYGEVIDWIADRYGADFDKLGALK